MKDAAGIQISTENNPDMGRVAQVMRTMAATSAETAALTFLMTPGLARKIAHHLDWGWLLRGAAGGASHRCSPSADRAAGGSRRSRGLDRKVPIHAGQRAAR